jgi:hypothetical protein
MKTVFAFYLGLIEDSPVFAVTYREPKIATNKKLILW